jgi:phosphoglycerate kinase
MIFNLKSVKNANVQNKTVFLRADLDAPIRSGKITDDTRLHAWFKTLEFLANNNSRIIIAGHLGRPEGKDEKLTLEPVAEWISKKIKGNLVKQEIGGLDGWGITENVSLLENLRFYKEEEENNDEFAKKLASLAQIYVNDAFASSHRAHASIVGITKFIPHFAGLRLVEEVEVLSRLLENPKRPFCVVIGGAKIETKLPLVEKMHHFADFVLVGGEIAENTKELLKVQHEKIEGRNSTLIIGELNEQKTDATLKSVENFIQIVQTAQTIVWNGPLGIAEDPQNKSTLEFAKKLSEINAYIIVGGGDTVGFLKENNLLDKFSFVSTGGGAMLEFLARVKLPGLVALEA